MGPDAALAACRFLHDGAAMALWGASAFLWALVPTDLSATVAQRLSGAQTAAIAVAVATTLAALPIEAAFIGNGWADALDPATVRAVLVETSVGWTWMAQAIAALLLVATLALPIARRSGATALASALVLATLALTGHAAMYEGWLGAAHRVNDTVHLLAGGAWLGALVPLVLLLQTLEDRAKGRDAATALQRFSPAGHVAVALVIATGVVNVTLVLRRWPTDWRSTYQVLLAVKVALVAVMVGLAALNRYRLVPRLAHTPASTLRALRRATVAEIALGVVVVGLVSIFGMLEPVDHYDTAPQAARTAPSFGGQDRPEFAWEFPENRRD